MEQAQFLCPQAEEGVLDSGYGNLHLRSNRLDLSLQMSLPWCGAQGSEGWCGLLRDSQERLLLRGTFLAFLKPSQTFLLCYVQPLKCFDLCVQNNTFTLRGPWLCAV